MTTADYRDFVDPGAVPSIPPEMRFMDFEHFPPPLEPLLGMWGPLSKQSFTGITVDGTVTTGLFDHALSGAPVEAAAKATTAWLASLSADMRAKASLPVDSDLIRHWQNTPLVLRDPQLEMRDLTDAQRQGALDIVKASLSSTGYQRTLIVMENNEFLGNLVLQPGLMNKWAFTMTVFGTPSTTEPWGWHLFGHHLALNCMFWGERMVLSPVFMGLEPDHADTELRRRMYEPHEAAALGVMAGLSSNERARAVLYDSMLTADQPAGRFHPDDGRSQGGAYQDNRVVPFEGLHLAGCDSAVRRSIVSLAEQFIDNLPEGPAHVRMNELERYLDQTYFAWIGKANDVDPFYFRIHSPVALIEFDHHSGIFLANREPARFHVHTAVRTPNGGDYGRDLLRLHYAQGNH